MKNHETSATWAYHNGTKHSYQSVRTNPHYLDWDNQPLPFKIYTNLDAISLGRNLSSSNLPALSAISTVTTEHTNFVELTRQAIAEVFFLSAGVTKRRSYPGGEILFRAAACTGALYHVDLYLVCGDLDDLDAGVYHFGPDDFALRRLRAGDHRGVLLQASGNEPAIVNAPAIVVCASTFWRNAWKYQARAYRHCYWDNGTILANFLAAAAARNLPAKVVLGFVDETVNQLLGLAAEREAPLCLVALADSRAAAPSSPVALEPLVLETRRLSKKEIPYPAMWEMHTASSLESEAEVVRWREQAQRLNDRRQQDGAEVKQLRFLSPLDEAELPQNSLEEVIVRRGSTRQFAREPITFVQLSTLLDRATRGVAADFVNPGESLNDLYLIVHAVEDLRPGAYFYHRDKRALELLKEGDFRREAGYLGLGQEIPADCSVNVYFLTDLELSLKRFGNRSYRATQLEAAIMGGKLYLAAYAQRLGASGLTFFDDDVTEFFSPHAAGKSVMFLIALGKSVKKKGLNII